MQRSQVWIPFQTPSGAVWKTFLHLFISHILPKTSKSFSDTCVIKKMQLHFLTVLHLISTFFLCSTIWSTYKLFEIWFALVWSNWHELMWLKIALTTIRNDDVEHLVFDALCSLMYKKKKKRLHFMMFGLKRGLVQISHKISGVQACEASLALLLISIEQNVEVSKVRWPLQMHLQE